MSIAALHSFLTTYLRDPCFRHRVAQQGISDALLDELGASLEEGALIRSIDLVGLSRSAVGLSRERRDRRSAEFPHFSRHLAGWCDLEDFWQGFYRAYPKGMLDRPLEMRRMLAYASEYIVRSGLPTYLIELLRFEYHVVNVGEAPRVAAPGSLDACDLVLPSDEVVLREPWALHDFWCDPAMLAQWEPRSMPGMPPEESVTLLIQKDWSLPKTSRVLRAGELFGVSGRRVMVLDLLAGFTPDAMRAAMAHLSGLARAGVIHVFRAL